MRLCPRRLIDMVILDSSVVIDLMAKRPNPWTAWVLQRRYVEPLGITSLILCESLQGLRYEDQVRPAIRLLSNFDVFETGSSELAQAAAMNYRSLRRLGLTVHSTIDCITATFCIQHGHRLLHRDRDFDGFEQHLGLTVLRPPEWPIQ